MSGAPVDPLGAIAEEYVHLVLAVGRHDDGYVDAYYGPPTWKDAAARGEPVAPGALRERAQALLERLRRLPPSDRADFLDKQLVAVEAFLRRLQGEVMSVDREALLLYDFTPPRHAAEEFEAARERLEALLPGPGDLMERVQANRERFTIPRDRLGTVVDHCLRETRRRTNAAVRLPEGETFRVSFVTGKSWNAYNWYQGRFQSLIEVNTDLPIEIHPNLITIAHEGYPGHHTFNALLEDRLVNGRGWPEYQVYPLHSPQSLLAEGTANLAVSIIMTPEEEWGFVEGTMAPEAGLAGLDFAHYREVVEALQPLRFVRGEALRLMLDEGRPDDEIAAFIRRHWLVSEGKARKSIDFIRAYRSYVFNYTAGEDLVRDYIGPDPGRADRYFELLQRPATPSGLLRATSGRAGQPASGDPS